jgi:hypothetical protein
MTVKEYIERASLERQAMLVALHQLIIDNDQTVETLIKPMMGKETIMYEQRGYMKYGLANVKNHISLHCLPMYMHPALHAKYVVLIPSANFQKGCINFADGDAMPLDALKLFIAECSVVDIAEVLENRKKKIK